jgi:hypothetical protein
MLAACRRRVANEDYRRRSSVWSEKAAMAAMAPIPNRMRSHTGQATLRAWRSTTLSTTRTGRDFTKLMCL